MARITVEPDDGAGEVTVALPATADCESANAICTTDSSPLSAAVTASVPRDASSETAVTPLTARFADVPALHVVDAFVMIRSCRDGPILHKCSVASVAGW